MYIAIDTDTNKYYTGKDTYRLKNIQSYRHICKHIDN